MSDAKIKVDELKPVNTGEGVGSDVSTAFETDILPVLNEIRKLLSKLYNAETDTGMCITLNEAVEAIDRYEGEKKAEEAFGHE